MSFLGCGIYYARSEHNFGEFIVTKFSDITDKIIAFFEKYPIQGVKSLDSTEFKRVAELMKNKDHLSQEGLEKIRQIKAGMDSPFPPVTPPSYDERGMGGGRGRIECLNNSVWFRLYGTII